MATCWVCRRLWSSVCARLISSGAIRLGASALVKFTSSSARAIDAPIPSSRPRAAWRSKNAWETVNKHVVPRGLKVGLPRGDHPTRRQRGEDRVGEPDEQARPAADEERLPALPEILAREEVLLHAVVPEVIDAGVEVGIQSALAWSCNGERLLDLHRRRGDVQRPDPGQLHRRREVDRQPARRLRIHPSHRQASLRRARGSAAEHTASAADS